MQFPGYTVDESELTDIHSIWKRDHIFFWVGTQGQWIRKINYTENDNSVIQEWVANPGIMVSDIFTSYDNITQGTEPHLTNNQQEKTVTWVWDNDMNANRSQQIQDGKVLENVLNEHTFRFPFSQTVTSNTANIACLLIDCESCDIDSWNSTLYSMFSGEDYTLTIPKKSDDCYVVSLFSDQLTTDGKTLEKGKFYKMSSEDISVAPGSVDNRILQVWT